MIRYILSGAVCTLLSISCFSQTNRSVVSSAGGSSSSENYKFEWTLGEMSVETISGRNIMFTQGFQQPSLSVKSLTEAGPEEISVMPNPVQSDLNILFKTLRNTGVQIAVVNESGQQVLTQQANIASGKITLNLSRFARGAYFLVVKDEHQKVIGSFKVIKN